MHLSVGDSLLVTVLGMTVVFAVLVILNLMIKGLSMLVVAAGWGSHEWANAPGTFIPAPELNVYGAAVSPVLDPSASGELKLYTVDEKTAAMIMAIVAYQSDTPLNELRFRSIRELSE